MTPAHGTAPALQKGQCIRPFSESPDLHDRGILRRLPHPVGQDLRRRGGRRTQRRATKKTPVRSPVPDPKAVALGCRAANLREKHEDRHRADQSHRRGSSWELRKILAAYERLAAAGAELVLAPELAITGYPPQDLVFKSRFVPQNLEALERLHQCLGAVPLLVGYVDHNDGRGKPFFNAAALLQRGQPIRKSFKTLLPTYDVFDEDRYFEPGSGGEVFTIAGCQVGITICEDIWTQDYLPRPLYDLELVAGLVAKGAEIIVNLSASPFSVGKLGTRREMVATVARTHQRPIVYCNIVGGNDELVFDGSSIAFNRGGELIAQLPSFQTAEAIVETDSTTAIPLPPVDLMAELFGALSLGVRDYLAKCNFKSAVLGLSGGIDSAVVAAIAVDSLGADNVVGVSMPSPYSSRGSIDDALALARNLGIRCLQIPIGDAFARFQSAIQENLRRIAGGHDRGKHAIALTRDDPDGALQQVRSPPPYHWQQERASLSATARSMATWLAGSP